MICKQKIVILKTKALTKHSETKRGAKTDKQRKTNEPPSRKKNPTGLILCWPFIVGYGARLHASVGLTPIEKMIFFLCE